MKICSKCKVKKGKNEFGKNKSCKDGLDCYCKECRKQINKQYRLENKEKVSESQRQYRENNREKRNRESRQWYKENAEYCKQYRIKNKEKIAERNKRYRIENREKIAEVNKQYSLKNKEKIAKRMSKWFKENKEKVNRRTKKYRIENKEKVNGWKRRDRQKRRALKKQLASTLTAKQWEDIKKYFNNECAYCGISEKEHKKRFGEQLHQEHFIPLSKGGGYVKDNIIPACKICNASKCNKDFSEWYPSYKYYSEYRKIKILKYLDCVERRNEA